MLKVEKVTWHIPPAIDDTGESLFKRNPQILFKVSAPIFWWKDTSFKFSDGSLLEYKNFSDFIFDEWEPSKKLIQELTLSVQQEQNKISLVDLDLKQFRRLLEIMPMGTMVSGSILLTYQEIIQYVEGKIIKKNKLLSS